MYSYNISRGKSYNREKNCSALLVRKATHTLKVHKCEMGLHGYHTVVGENSRHSLGEIFL